MHRMRLQPMDPCLVLTSVEGKRPFSVELWSGFRSPECGQIFSKELSSSHTLNSYLLV